MAYGLLVHWSLVHGQVSQASLRNVVKLQYFGCCDLFIGSWSFGSWLITNINDPPSYYRPSKHEMSIIKRPTNYLTNDK